MEQYDKLTTKLSACRKVGEMIATDGWRNVIAPRIELMISDYAGGLRGEGQYILGKINESNNSEEIIKRIGIREGMLRVYNMIMCHPRDADSIVERLRVIEENKDKGYQRPMEGSPYDPEG